MRHPTEFASQLLTVVTGVAFFVMTAAFVLLPYSLAAHPCELPAPAPAVAYHPT